MQARLDAIRRMDTEGLRQDFLNRWSLPSTATYVRGTCKDTLYTFAVALGGKRLANVMEAILRSPHVYYRGFPDLSFWKIDNNNINSTVKIEVDDEIMMHTNDNYQPKHCCTKPNDNYQPNPPWINDTFFAVEVKSKNDKLSKYQEAIHEMLNKAGIHIEVLKVTDPSI